MYASYVDMQLKLGKTAAAMEMARQMEEELGQMGSCQMPLWTIFGFTQ